MLDCRLRTFPWEHHVDADIETVQEIGGYRLGDSLWKHIADADIEAV